MSGPVVVDVAVDQAAAELAAAWAAELIERGRRAGEVPLFGSPAWAALPDADPRKVASCVRAAECRRREGEPAAIAARLRAELAADSALAVWRLRAMSVDLAGAADWAAAAGRPSAVELARRREYGPLPAGHPLAGRQPWSPADLGEVER